MGRLFESGRRRRTDRPKPGLVPANPPSERAARGLRTRRMAQTQGVQTFGGKASPLLVADGVTLQYRTTDHLVTATWRGSFEGFTGERFARCGPLRPRPGGGKPPLQRASPVSFPTPRRTAAPTSKPTPKTGSDPMMVF